MKVNTFKRF
jgi:hypothetical protein